MGQLAPLHSGDQNGMPGNQKLSVEELEEQKRRILACEVLDLDDSTKRQRQVYFKVRLYKLNPVHDP
jgi:flagellar biosynthesis regulator FlbT